MARNSISGYTKPELKERRAEFEELHADDDKEFEETFCLAKIPRQPPDYDGPQRFCMSDKTRPIGSNNLCKFHGGAGSPNAENMDKLASMEHGMRALRKHVREDFTEKDTALYEWVVERYPEAYGMSIEESPADAYDVHRLAVEIVRAERGREHLLREGEVHEEEKVGENGLVLDDSGEIVTELSEHYLAGMMDRQDRKITKLQKELGVTRKERQQHETETDAVEAMKGFAELGKNFVKREEKEYDPDGEPWSDEE